MKKYIYILILALMLAGMLLSLPFFDSCEALTEDVLRVHILANSDSAADQSLKLGVRDRVLAVCSDYYAGCESKEQAIAVTESRLSEIETVAAEEIARRGFRYPVRAEVCEGCFDTRYYENFTLPAGRYSCLRLTIGDAEGANWWCVLYPTLCVGAASAKQMRDSLDDGEYEVVTSDKYDFRFKLVEYWEDVRRWVNGE